jgi:selenophosphate synthase
MNDVSPRRPAFRLTELAHGGGCGCKLAPAVLQQLLAGQTAALFPQLLVGTETSDDAAVWQLSDEQCVIATTDFFMPIVDDPHDFGRIAATNAISDVYAMGGTPILALAILGMPLGKLPIEVARDILAGGAAVCAGAGIPVAGGHSNDLQAPPPECRLAAGNRPCGRAQSFSACRGANFADKADDYGECEAQGTLIDQPPVHNLLVHAGEDNFGSGNDASRH